MLTFDRIELTDYEGNNPGTVLYISGGEGGTIVETITITYDIDGNILTVTES